MSGKSSSTRYARLVAAFAGSAFALLMVATFEHQSAQEEVANLIARPRVAATYEYRRMGKCGTQLAKSHPQLAAKICRTVTK